MENAYLHLNEDVVFVDVSFTEHDKRTYAYKALKQWGLYEYCQAVVNVSGQFKVVCVEKIHQDPPKPGIKYKWIVSRLDTEAYDNIVRKEAQFERKIAEAAKLNYRQAYLDDLRRQVGIEKLSELISFMKED